MRFAGKVAVVTGGAGGIGRAVAEALATEGATVAVADVAGADAGTLGESVRRYQVDVADAGAVADFVARVGADHGGPHILIALAGGSLGTPRDLPDIGPADLDAVLDVNVKGTFYCCQAVAPLMAAAGGGAIVTCSSIGARLASPTTGAPYAAAKAAIGGLTRRLARELGPAAIRINAVAPGLFLTPRLAARFDAMPDFERDEIVSAIPLGRMPSLREIVDPILFLASDAASFVTGITLDVNGGRYLPA